MKCPDLDLVLDAGFDVPADIRAHLADCASCSSELAVAAAVAAGFAEMRTETAPPTVVDAALARARQVSALPASSGPTVSRRAPDRSARRQRLTLSPRRAAALAVVAVALAVIGWVVRPHPSDVSRESVASAEPRPAPSGAAPSGTAPSGTARDTSAVAALAPEPTRPDIAAPVAPTAPPADPRPSLPASPPTAPPADPPPPIVPPTQETAPAPSVEQPAPQTLAVSDPVVPDSVAAARQGALLALELIADAQTLAHRTVSSEVQRLGTTLSDAVSSPHSP